MKKTGGLAVMLVIVVLLAGISMAKYVKGVMPVEETARVAVMESGVTDLELSASVLVPAAADPVSNATELSFLVTNYQGSRTAEVNLSYVIRIRDLTGMIPLTFRLKDDSGNSGERLIRRKTENGEGYWELPEGFFSAARKEAKEYHLEVAWDTEGSTQYSHYRYQGMGAYLPVEVTAVQTD